MLHGVASAELGRGKRQALEVSRQRQVAPPQQQQQQQPYLQPPLNSSEGSRGGGHHAVAPPAPVVVSLSAHAGRDAPADPTTTPFAAASGEREQAVGMAPSRQQHLQPGAGAAPAAGGGAGVRHAPAGSGGEVTDGRCAVSRVRGGALVPLEGCVGRASGASKAEEATDVPDQAPRGKDPRVVSQLAQDLAELRAATSEAQATASTSGTAAKGKGEAPPKRTQSSWLAGLPHITTVRRMGRPAEREGA